MVGYQNPFGKVLVLVGENLQEVTMLRKGALVEYLKKKNFSEATYRRLEKQIQSEEKPSEESPKKDTVQSQKKQNGGIPDQLEISMVANSNQYPYGAIVSFQNSKRYKKGLKY